ncbi:carnitine dehydratase [Tardibacter chloracetimidivorans]|uniref:Carnitine dehydratase n=1 Tax=Tardibacter chloracetimidivorans TaxID=1921510 RepID=A0A1L3ZSS8_9SPHN|nr:CoA transferase [Tardibacter chloracetimidivorans]API58696.1 carnitine dehydratase [Tardibacter chloracetimidivorans]
MGFTEKNDIGATQQVLDGIRVLELGHFVAAPFCTRLLADLGADVIKIEPLQGDPVRQWGAQIEGRSLWWSVHGRNKRSIALDLKTEAGRDVVLKLLPFCDVVVENFRPGQLERMGLGPDVLRAVKPDIIIAHISGYGQSGPGRDRAAFGVIGEAVGGIRHLTNHPPGQYDLPPVRVGVSIGDSIAGLYAAFGIVSALWRKERTGTPGSAKTIDVALTESVLSMMEAMLPEYGALGIVKQPTGGGIATAAPSNAYPTADGEWILIAANSDPLFAKLVQVMNQDILQTDPRFQGNAARVANAATLDEIIGNWTKTKDAKQLAGILADADIPSSKVYTAADVAEDPQYRARQMVRDVDDPALGKVLHPGVVPCFPESPAEVRWTGPDIGAHSAEILKEFLDLPESRIADLKAQGVVR